MTRPNVGEIWRCTDHKFVKQFPVNDKVVVDNISGLWVRYILLDGTKERCGMPTFLAEYCKME